MSSFKELLAETRAYVNVLRLLNTNVSYINLNEISRPNQFIEVAVDGVEWLPVKFWDLPSRLYDLIIKKLNGMTF